MRSEKQIQASRRNGAKSRGPISPEGKITASRNSFRHGLLASTVVLEAEIEDRFIDLLRALVDEFQPTTTTQLCLVETMAVARWRLLRIWGAQKTAVDREMSRVDPNVGPVPVQTLFALRGSADTISPELLMRYEVAYDRQFSRALSRLLLLQSQPRKSESAASLPESDSAERTQEPYEPRASASGISSPQPELPAQKSKKSPIVSARSTNNPPNPPCQAPGSGPSPVPAMVSVDRPRRHAF